VNDMDTLLMTRTQRLRRDGRLARVHVGLDRLPAILMGEMAVEWTGLPADAEMVNCAPEWQSDSIVLLFAHEDFPVTPEGEMVTYLFPAVYRTVS